MANTWTKERAAEYAREWYRQNRDVIREQTKERRVRNGHTERARARRHGLTVEQLRAILVRGACDICGSQKNLRVDHCHVTGKVRGLLCHFCNAGLGHFRDDPKLMHAAVLYLAGLL